MGIAKQYNSFSGYKAVGHKRLKALFLTMYKIRFIEERIAALYPQEIMRCPVHLCSGQEAIPAAVQASLDKCDMVFGSHRAHGYYIAMGGDIGALFAELSGKMTGCTKGRGGSQHLAAPSCGFMGGSSIVAGTIPIAAGAALAFAIRRKKNVAVVDFGDGATDEGSYYEAVNFAALKKLPVIFVCQNNLYATHAHIRQRHANGDIAAKARAFGVEAYRINGNDVIGVFNAFSKCVTDARRGRGPSLLECMTYRWREHVGPNYDYGLGYRSRYEFNAWKSRCPVATYREFLVKRKIATAKWLEDTQDHIAAAVDRAVSYARRSPDPGPGGLLSNVYYMRAKRQP